MSVAVTLVSYRGLSENQARVTGGERQLSDKQTAVYCRGPAPNETPVLCEREEKWKQRKGLKKNA